MTASSESHATSAPDWSTAVENSKSVSALISLIRSAGMSAIADRLEALSEGGDAVEADETPASLKSLRGFASSIRELSRIGDPLIALSDDGVLVAEWQVAADRHLAIKFLGANTVSFAMISPGHAPGDRARLSGTGPSTDALAAMRTYGIERW